MKNKSTNTMHRNIPLLLSKEYIRFTDLLNDEQYHIDTIKSQYPDTYDFMCSVRDGLHNIGDYQ